MNLIKADNRLIYDVGMHKGEDTDYYSKKGFRVVGFEADPYLVKYCKKRFSDRIRKGELSIIEGAIVTKDISGEDQETVKFYRNKDSSVLGTVSPGWANRNEMLGTVSEIVEVPIVDFAACLAEYGIPYYLKIDIEGSDSICLKALLNFEQRPSYVSIESEKIVFYKLIQEFTLLRQLGYTKFKAVQQMGVSLQSEPNPSKEGLYIGYRFENGSSGLFGEDLPGKWKNGDEIIKEYKKIFRLYNLFGDYGKLNKFCVGRMFLKVLNKILRIPVPGWYDTHAKHLSVI